MMRGIDADGVEEAARRLRDAKSTLFVTGAGISADSGLPTYRGIGGLYEIDDTEDGVPIEEALSGRMFRSNPALCWKHIGRIEAACRGARPNRAHEIIAELERSIPRCWVLTQNVDGLHGAAGSKNLIEIHGNIHHLICTGCTRRETVEDYSGLELPPRCDSCGGMIRPEVVLFGEMLPVDPMRLLHEQMTRGFDVVFSIGTTSVFPYIAEPVLVARRRGGVTIEINPGTSEVSGLVDQRIAAGSAMAMEAIFAAI